MYAKKFIPLIFLILIIGACKNKKDPSSVKTLIDTLTISEDSAQTSYVSQTEPVEVDSPTVVFFMPSYRERAEIIHFYGEYTRYDFEYIFNNFQKLASISKYPLNQKGINSFLTYNWKFKIKTDSGYVNFDRKAEDEILGIILADGHKAPMIRYGLYKNKELAEMVRNYFGIKDFKLRANSIDSRYLHSSQPQDDGNP